MNRGWARQPVHQLNAATTAVLDRIEWRPRRAHETIRRSLKHPSELSAGEMRCTYARKESPAQSVDFDQRLYQVLVFCTSTALKPGYWIASTVAVVITMTTSQRTNGYRKTAEAL